MDLIQVSGSAEIFQYAVYLVVLVIAFYMVCRWRESRAHSRFHLVAPWLEARSVDRAD
jgi:uncharacterized membrane protein YfcA